MKTNKETKRGILKEVPHHRFSIRISFDATIEAETEKEAIKLALIEADRVGFNVCVDGYTHPQGISR